ncbi:MAG: polyribonucleotide nucleotidyltransferase [Bacilli bacterium]|nr:polyribonucleotide nucleotidyltransferase [Bacilli bacterium]MDD4053840.1 polyribonucleotide nucleotidyltransferase [Bacilli bacterium]MDD4411293.1 polyribonucleotide nucleotidyltransferase [Bacilli bacterium]
MDKKIFTLDFRGRKIVVEHGELAKQAHGAVLVRYGDTAVLSATVGSKSVSAGDFFPLTVIYNEKQYSVGKIPGGFIKREGRPTENATLTARLIDRPIRPLFPEGYKNEVQIINTVLSVDQDNSPEMSALFGSSLALSVSEIPFDEPVAGVVVGRVDDEFIINPTAAQAEASELSLTIAGTATAITMVEAGSKEVSEEVMLEAMLFGHEAIKELVAFQNEIISEIGVAKDEFEIPQTDEELTAEVNNIAKDKMIECIKIKEKIARYEAIDNLKEEVIESYREKYQDDVDRDDIVKKVRNILDDVEWLELRRLIVDEKIRPDGRGITEIRPLSGEVDLLARTHGSALFTRGQTQSLSVTTLGAIGEHQILDGLGVEADKRFLLHYNFPQFSVGETGRYGSPGRREIGHGALGERALLQVIPSEEEFPYTIRVVSEILESNGSSSQASICAGCMSLMAAGVPVKAPVAGIAMGLVSDGENYTVLTDIQGIEDHMGDMDFKVAGTRNGICALQMDIKIKGINGEIIKEALEQARIGRMQILDVMENVIAEPRKELSPYAPKIKQIMINPSKIKDVIGRGGDMISKIIEDCGNVKIDIEDDGRVVVYHTDYQMIDKAIAVIEDIVREVEEGKIYTAKVVKVEEFGCFVQLWPGCEGLVHISQLANEHVSKTEDVVKLGDEIIVKALGYDKKGRLNLSRKEVFNKDKEKEPKKETEEVKILE